MTRVLLAGEYYLDLIFTGLSEAPRLGAEVMAGGVALVPGASFTTLKALARLGVPADWWVETGNDPFSALILDALRAEGLSLAAVQRRDEPRIRVTAAFSTATDRAFVSRFEGGESLPDPEAVAGATHLLVNGLTGLGGLPALFARARRAGTMTLLDPQHSGLRAADLLAAIRQCDLFLPNEPEALSLTHAHDWRRAGEALSALGPKVALKLGAEGAALFESGSLVAVAEAPPVRVADTTGAGDAFAAGLLFGLAEGLTLAEALRPAVHTASASVTGPGGTALPDRAALLASLAQAADPTTSAAETDHETS